MALVLLMSGLVAADLPDLPPIDFGLPKAPIPQPVVAELENGLKVLTVQTNRLPYVVVALACRAGAQCDPRMKAGMSYMTSQALVQGTTSRSQQEIQETVNTNGLTFRVDADHEAVYVTLGALPETLDTGMSLMADVVRNPSFAQESWERLQVAQRRQQLRQKRVAQYRTLNVLNRHLFGHHYYARSLYGTEITIERLDHDKMQKFYQGHFGADRTVLVFCGVIDPADAKALAQEYFGDWHAAGEPLPEVMAPPKPRERYVYVLDEVRAMETTVRIGRLGVARDDQRYPPLRTLMAVLAARLEEDGAAMFKPLPGGTSTVDADTVAGPSAGLISITFVVPPEQTGKAIRMALDTCSALGSEPVAARFLESANARLSGELALALETTTQLADQHLRANLYGLSGDWYGRLLDQLAAVTPEQLQATAREYLNPENLLVIVHANATAIQPYMDEFAPYDVYVDQAKPGETTVHSGRLSPLPQRAKPAEQPTPAPTTQPAPKEGG